MRSRPQAVICPQGMVTHPGLLGVQSSKNEEQVAITGQKQRLETL